MLGLRKIQGAYCWAARVTTTCFAGVAKGIGAAGGVFGNAERSDVVGLGHAAGFCYPVKFLW